MANSGIMQRVFGKSPLLEVVVRNIYWRNINFFSQVNKKKIAVDVPIPERKASLDKLFEQWRAWGIQKGDILMVISSYVELSAYNLEPEQLIDAMIDFLGEEGTLVMPAFPYFKNMPKKDDFLRKNISSEVFTYHPLKNLVTTGLLPGTLIKYAGSIRSSFPINSLVALGKHAGHMFLNEWDEKDPLPCGPGSAWAYCAERNAKIVSLGTDLTHSLTMIHVAEDSNNHWPVRSWYREKKFLLTERTVAQHVILRERHPMWGTLYFAERKLCNDLLSNGLMKSTYVDGIITEEIDSSALLEFLHSRNQFGYPYYYIPSKFMIC